MGSDPTGSKSENFSLVPLGSPCASKGCWSPVETSTGLTCRFGRCRTMRQESHGFLRFAPEATAENGSHQRSRLPARLLCAGGTRPATTELTNENGSERLLCPSGARSAMSEATAEFSTGDLPPTGTRSPLKGVLVSGGDQHRPERSGESCHGFAVTEGFRQKNRESPGFIWVSSELEPLHHLTVVPEGCKATFFPYSGEARC